MESGKASLDFADRPVFAAVIQPHRSLDRNGLRTVMALCCLAGTAASIPFLVLGLWPVAGFFGLELLALCVAISANARSGRSFEQVVLTPFELLLRRVSHRGERREWRFNPLWTKLGRETDDEFGLQRLWLISCGEHVALARELSPRERETFAAAFGTALMRVKRGA